MGADDGNPKIPFASTADWERWLEDNHTSAEGVWIKMAKKGADIESVRYPEVLECAICFGWIDARREALDERYFLQRFTPRRQRSRWSRINSDKAEPDGRWKAAYEGQKRSTVPDDLQRELDARPKAKEFFAELSSQNRYAIIYRLNDARKPETRARRLAKLVAMLEAGETIH